MSILEFIAAVLKATAWPGVVLTGMLVFRTSLSERIKSIHKISHGKTEVLFDEQAREVQAAIAAGGSPDLAKGLLASEGALEPSIGKIVLTWNRLEEAIRARLPAETPRLSTLAGAPLVEQARQAGLITTSQFQALSGLRAMRNLAVHAPEGKMDQTRVDEFVVLADAMATVLGIDTDGR